uniref:Putative alpha-tubulin suppressor n=1 Tax=Culex tarsalis TaxID=7177 RepID=A0A1Q3F6U9_CULTA
MLCWGANSHGQLGLGYHSESIERPQQVDSLPFDADDVLSIGCGGGHTLVSNQTTGDLYATGWNNRGQLGLGHTEDMTRFTLVGRFHFEQISCGWDVSGGLTVDGDLYLWGSNVWQQVNGGSEKFVPTPTKLSLPAGSKAKKVCFGLRHTCVLTETGSLLLLGKSKWIPKETEMKTVAHAGIDFYTPELAEKITDVASGENHLVVRLENGSIICIGDNKFGQSANGADLNVCKRAVIKLDSGWSHSGYLTKGGQVYLWGRNNYGQLGCGAEPVDEPPTLLDLESNVTEFCLGSQHGLALAADGLFTWGWNEHGNCGTGGTNNVLTPTKLDEMRRVTKIAAGAGFCCVLVKKA